MHRSTGSTFYCLESQAETIYYPFCHRWDFSKGAEKANFPGKSIYLSHISERYAYETLEILYRSEWDEKRLYLTPSLFNSFQQNINEQKWSFTENLEENFSVCYKRNKRGIEGKEDMLILQKANVAYMFNYADEPNEGYFFVNNYEYGEKIITTPYLPLRSGYTFEGWYKEAECKNPWNFETDYLPAAKYDEQGKLEFFETKLYAKWS